MAGLVLCRCHAWHACWNVPVMRGPAESCLGAGRGGLMHTLHRLSPQSCLLSTWAATACTHGHLLLNNASNGVAGQHALVPSI